jgi:chromosomal replication initiator protein
VDEQLRLDEEDVPITLRRAWDRALRQLSTQVNKPTFEAHIRTLKPLSMAEEQERDRPVTVVTLGVPSVFTREWVEKRHAALIASLLEEAIDRDVRLKFVLCAKERVVEKSAASMVAEPLPPGPRAPLAPPAPTPRPQPTSLPAAPEPRGARSERRETPSPALNGRYTFDAFVVGPTNRLAHAGAQAVAQAPGQVYNPLFLYGPPGLGKTHLMHAIGNQIVQQVGSERVAYFSGEAFASHYIASLREQRADEFRRRWRSVDVFLVDDIQFIAGKEHTKEEFFHTFNALYQTGKQIVISSDRSPRELRTMDERLRSRFECGLIADIAPPDLETRLAILHRKAETEQMRIPDEVLLYMARLVQSNIRTLEGALVKLIAYASMAGSPVTTELAADILERYYISAGFGENRPDATPEPMRRGTSPLPRNGDGGITAEIVQRVVARRFGLAPDALTGKRRDREIAHARQIAMHLMRELTEMSLPGIGQLFGGRDHSTVAHACDRIRSLLPFDDDLRTLVEDLILQTRSQAGH